MVHWLSGVTFEICSLALPVFLFSWEITFFSVKNVSCRETAQQGNQLLLLLVSHEFSLHTKRYVVFIFKDIIGIFYYYSSKNE